MSKIIAIKQGEEIDVYAKDIRKMVQKLASKEKLKKLRKFLIAVSDEKIILKNLERLVPQILKLDPKNLPQALLKIKRERNLTDDILGNFIQKILLEKYKIHQKDPEFKSIIWNFSKENHIHGIQFPYI